MRDRAEVDTISKGMTAGELDALHRVKVLHDEMRAEANGPPDPEELRRRFDKQQFDRDYAEMCRRFNTRGTRGR